MHKMAKSYESVMPYSERLLFFAANGSAASFAYDRLHLHLTAARLQMDRIGQAVRTSHSVRPEPSADATQEQLRARVRGGQQRMRVVLTEVHFYFVCWSGCRNMLQILVGQPEFIEAKKVFDGYRKEFEHYVAGRNSFEHFHGRLPGQSEEGRVKAVQSESAGPRRIYAGLSSGKYIHSSLEWDITPNSMECLQKYVDEMLAVVHRIVDEKFSRQVANQLSADRG
jgi:hypothetical protein